MVSDGQTIMAIDDILCGNDDGVFRRHARGKHRSHGLNELLEVFTSIARIVCDSNLLSLNVSWKEKEVGV